MKEQRVTELIKNVVDQTYTEDIIEICTCDQDGKLIEGALNFNDEKTLLLVEVLKKNSSVVKLKLNYNNISDIGALALSFLTNIEELYLVNNKITIKGAIALAKGNFKKLHLSDNPLMYNDNEDATPLEKLELADAFINNKTIEELYLSGCGLDFTASEMIAKIIGYNNSIKKLDLSINYLKGEAFKYIGNNSSLEDLSFYQNEIDDKGTEYLLTNQNLRKLSLSNNKITDIGVKFLSNHSSLKHLDLGNNEFTSNSLRYFLSSGLEYIRFGWKIPFEEQEAFYREFQEVKEIKEFLLQENIDKENFDLLGEIITHEKTPLYN